MLYFTLIPENFENLCSIHIKNPHQHLLERPGPRALTALDAGDGAEQQELAGLVGRTGQPPLQGRRRFLTKLDTLLLYDPAISHRGI